MLREALGHAERWGLIARNPVKLTNPPKPHRTERRIWDEEQVRLFLAKAKRESRPLRPLPDGDPHRHAAGRQIRFHDLRHAHVSYLALAGVPVKVAQDRVGHSSAMMTLDVYGHVLPGMQADAARKVEALLLGTK